MAALTKELQASLEHSERIVEGFFLVARVIAKIFSSVFGLIFTIVDGVAEARKRQAEYYTKNRWRLD